MKALTPENTKGGSVKIFLNDEDVSALCFYALVPDQPYKNGDGMVKLYIGQMHGKTFEIDVDENGDLKFEEKQGLVRWEPIS